MKTRFVLTLFLVVFVFAQESMDQQKTNLEQTKGQPKEPSKKKSMEESLANKKEIPGVFTLYQDEENGKLYMLLKNDQFEKEYIHFVHGLNGQINTGVFKGSYRGARVFKLKRYFNRVETR